MGELNADFRLALSGTPVENRLGELWSIMSLLNPGLLGSAQRFTERFANAIERDRDEAAQRTAAPAGRALPAAPDQGRGAADLPPRTEIVHRIEPGRRAPRCYEALRREALAHCR
jgi:SNF2 family DNA or RNA helicase